MYLVYTLNINKLHCFNMRGWEYYNTYRCSHSAKIPIVSKSYLEDIVDCNLVTCGNLAVRDLNISE